MLRKLFSKLDGTEPAPQERRREDRKKLAGGTVEIDGRSYPVENWSYTGFLAGSYEGARKAGDRVDITFTVETGGRDFTFSCKAMMVRVDPASRKVVGAFVDMDAGVRAKIARHFD